ncbi:MAG: hypothetical protein E6K77_03385 [Candidatus Eisenbacteria bacterium]|uniref:Uncharacterized protein n=1 Tax=Eiseniibacteriota bacterium TaxID=2212470 RepID=A0A538TMV4_UNCEI|nr:MAG: hypothetical protein E6K74_04705 [Candidatus Eisenbacteria bacterium]TMQ64952.1 MAG: hypothetical protein E6K77_03385 [Candidatus Eisenbacteria bacterium]
MKWTRAVLAGMAMAGVTALIFVGGCTSTSTRADLVVESVNNGGPFFSDLLNEADTAKTFIPVDKVVVRFANRPHDGSATVAPGTGFSEIVVLSYTVTYNNGIYSPVSGGMNVIVPSGGTAEGAITISDLAQKAALPLSTAATAVAQIDFTGYLRASGSWGDAVTARAYLTVQVANFGDTNTNP